MIINWHKLGVKTEPEEEFGGGNTLTIKNGLNPAEIIESQLGPFNRWAVCTDFDINDQQVKLINDLPGVESVAPVSRYRLKFIIGDAFNDAVVRRSIDEVLRQQTKKPPTHKNFLTAESIFILKSLGSKWAVLESENQATYFVASIHDDEWADNLITTLKHAANELNANLITS